MNRFGVHPAALSLTQGREPNVYQQNARTKKVGQLVAHFDLSAETVGLKPHTTDAGTIAGTLAAWTDGPWLDAAREANVSTPSKEVRDMVVSVYKERASK